MSLALGPPSLPVAGGGGAQTRTQNVATADISLPSLGGRSYSKSTSTKCCLFSCVTLDKPRGRAGPE